MSSRFLYLAHLILVLWLVAACRPIAEPTAPTATYSDQLTTDWFALQLKLIEETPGFTPPVASRALGYSGVTLYEAVVGGMAEHNSLVGQLNGLTGLPGPETSHSYHWAAAANSALATILRHLYSTATAENLAAIDALEQRYHAQYRAEVSEEAFNRSVTYGNTIAEAVWEWSKSDGGYQGYTSNFSDSFIPQQGAGLWVATPPDYLGALQPEWGTNRPFAIPSGETCNAPPPTEYSEDPSSPFYAEAYEVYMAVKNLTPEQREIALFWADDPGATFTPAGHWIAITAHVLGEQNADLALAAESYASVGIAMADAFVSCWHSKYQYNLIRPITYIQSVIDPAWNSPELTDPVTTPPFPEYPSGHSVQSGAAAAVLTALFGDNYRFTDAAHTRHGLATRSFDSFYDAADEAAISRLYGGIHYRPAIERGVEQGKCIGDYVNALNWKRLEFGE